MSEEFEKENQFSQDGDDVLENEEIKDEVSEEVQDDVEDVSETLEPSEDYFEHSEPDLEDVEETSESKQQLKGWKKELLEWIQSLAIAIVAALLIVNFVFTLVRVSGSSMEPTLQDHNCLFVLRLGYQPHNGDIIVFKPVGDPKKYYIKRVIATEGQEVDLHDGKVFVDGKELTEPYIQGITYDTHNSVWPKTVPKNCVFALGDNRQNSRDSRDMLGVGMIERKTIVGKAWFRLFPFNKVGSLYK